MVSGLGSSIYFIVGIDCLWEQMYK